MSELIIGGNFTTPPYSMFSDIAEAASHKYYMYRDKSNRIWLVGDEPNAAEHIYVDGGKGSNGFGGRTLTFELVDGSTIDLIGPWHTNSGALLKAVGIDLHDKYFTWGCIGTDRHFSNGNSGISNLIYIDKEPVLGKFDRIDNLAKQVQRIEGTLGNPGFVNKAPTEIIERERVKLGELQGKREQLSARLSDLAT